MDPNQGTQAPEPSREGEGEPYPRSAAGAPLPGADDAGAVALEEAAAAEADAARAAALHVAEAVGGMARSGLFYWTVLVAVGVLGGVVLRAGEVTVFLALAALFALGQSWDARDGARTGDPRTDQPLLPGEVGQMLRWGAPLVLPFAGAMIYSGMGLTVLTLGTDTRHATAAAWCFAGAAVSLLTAFRPVVLVAARVLVRDTPTTHTARITASLAVLVLLLPAPFRLMADEFMARFAEDGRALVDMNALLTQLAGEVVLALAAVGLWVKRDRRETARRLGLGPMKGRDFLVALIGLIAVIAVNYGMEWLQRERFHDLWLTDQATTKLMVGQMSVAGALVLGVSAGVGEEVLVRGALQPRTGVVWAAVLFAAGHVQYTWFGMLTILLLGLSLGLVRRWSNTTAAIVVHVVYDVIAVLASPR